MESQHYSQQSFAEALDLSPASLSSIFNDRTKPTLNHVDAIRKKFPQINLDWLLYGTGQMFVDNSSQSQNADSGTQTEPMLDFDAPSSPLPFQESAPVTSNAQQPVHRAVETVVKYIDKPQRRISEIRVYYDDQTWETFVSSSK